MFRSRCLCSDSLLKKAEEIFFRHLQRSIYHNIPVGQVGLLGIGKLRSRCFIMHSMRLVQHIKSVSHQVGREW